MLICNIQEANYRKGRRRAVPFFIQWRAPILINNLLKETKANEQQNQQQQQQKNTAAATTTTTEN